MKIKTTNYFHTGEEASRFINSLPQGTKISLGLEHRTTVNKEFDFVNEIVWRVTCIAKPKNEADYNMTILHDLYYNEALNQEHKDAVNYAISCIKTLQDMEIIK